MPRACFSSHSEGVWEGGDEICYRLLLMRAVPCVRWLSCVRCAVLTRCTAPYRLRQRLEAAAAAVAEEQRGRRGAEGASRALRGRIDDLTRELLDRKHQQAELQAACDELRERVRALRESNRRQQVALRTAPPAGASGGRSSEDVARLRANLARTEVMLLDALDEVDDLRSLQQVHVHVMKEVVHQTPDFRGDLFTTQAAVSETEFTWFATPEAQALLSSDAAWRRDEDETLYLAQEAYGDDWVRIAKQLPGRTDVAVRERWCVVGVVCGAGQC